MSDTKGIVTVSILAGHIQATHVKAHPLIGKQLAIGDDIHVHITPDVARQWIGVLEQIAATEEEAA